MPRFKTVGVYYCDGTPRHTNLFDNRNIANTAEEAQDLNVKAVAGKKCNYCDGRQSGAVQIMGTEEVTLHPEYFVRGYTCICGERVAVMRAEKERSFEVPQGTTTFSCTKGHTRKIRNPEDILTLEHWEEKTN